MIKNGLLSKKKVVVDNSLAGKMKTDIYLRTAFNFISNSVAQAKALGFTDKNDMDFTVFELADRLKSTKNCQKCGVEVSNHNVNIEFIKSIMDGGELKARNLRMVCLACNTKK